VLLCKLDELLEISLILGVSFDVEDLSILLYMIWDLVKGGGVKSLQSRDLRANQDPWDCWGAVVLVILLCHTLMFSDAGGVMENRIDGLENGALGSSSDCIVPVACFFG